jgi:hypothetical protein
MSAAGRGNLQRTVILAHQVVAIELDSYARDGKRKLKPIRDYLKPFEARPSLDEGAAKVAEMLDLKIAKESRTAARAAHTNPAAGSGEGRNPDGSD